MTLPTLRDLHLARKRTCGLLRRTPLVESDSLSALTAAPVFLKLESLQTTGAFKLRGATNRLLMLSPEERERGVVTVSTGNHGRALAFAARRLGMRAVVCLSQLVPENKRAAIRKLGAELRIVGHSQDEAAREAERLIGEEGLIYVPPFDDFHIIAGQGTLGLEILEDCPEVEELLIPLSGGGLISGVALAVKGSLPGVRVVGISMERGAAMYHSLQAGRPVEVEEEKSLADSLGGGIGLDNRFTFPLVRELVDEVVLLSEAEIAAGMRHLFREERLVAEGGAAVGVAAILAGKAGGRGRTSVAVVSGCNVDMDAFLTVVG